MSERNIYKGIEEPSYLLAWTVTEFTFCFALWGFFAVICHQYLLGMVFSGGLALVLVTKRTEFSVRCQLQHILHKFGLWRGKSSLQQHYKDISPYSNDDEKPQLIFPESSQVEFLSHWHSR